MDKTVFTSLSRDELENLIIDCVNLCLKHHPAKSEENQEDDLIPIEKAAALLNYAKQTLYTKSSKGEITSYKKGNRLYFSKKDLDEWIRSGKKKSQAEIKAEVHTFLKEPKR